MDSSHLYDDNHTSGFLGVIDFRTGTNNSENGCSDTSPMHAHRSLEPPKRKRGRPRKLGGTNPLPKRGRGRPKGSLNKQSSPTRGIHKRPVGRPRKQIKFVPTTVSVVSEKFTVPGIHPERCQSVPTLLKPRNIPEHISSSEPPTVSLPTSTMTSPTEVPFPNQYQRTVPDSDSLQIIADEDLLRPIDDNDDDAEEGVGDGIGEDVLGDSNKEGNDGEPSRRQLPPWLSAAFDARLKDANNRNSAGIPYLYAYSRTFWFPQQATYFTLENTPHVAPSQLYSPRFFLWDPATLTQIPCPRCGQVLTRHGHIERPRRVVDLNGLFWIVGYRYRCLRCSDSAMNTRATKSTTYRSWDPAILDVLPQHLANEFPAVLSHRSGMSKSLLPLMRACFQHGMGSKQFSDTLRTLHILKYDELHLQYLKFLALRRNRLDRWLGEKYHSFLSFDDVSPEGFHGYVPSSAWLRDIYDQYIEEHEAEINQHTGMLTAKICAIDHSHKVTKHLARVEGEQVFTGLLTITNEIGQIRSCSLVATKAHSQFQSALTCMEHSLQLYGHEQPQVFYTDNIADKQFLENSFPSLRNNVVPVEKYSSLNPLNLSNEQVEIFPKTSVQAINDAMSTILNDVPLDDGFIVVGFDSEWNVELSPWGQVTHNDKTAIVQIAYQKRVYILQIRELVAEQVIPHKLELLLSHPRILKVGRLVGNDLKRLQDVFRLSKPLSGAVDLAKFAKDRAVIRTMQSISLSDLTAIVLRKRLDKNTSLRTDQQWDNITLTANQLDYAAKDAYAALAIYRVLSLLRIPLPLPPSGLLPPPNSPVLLYNSDNTTIIARAKISGDAIVLSNTFDGVSITSAKAVVDITHVFVPGAIIGSHNSQSLRSFGSPPFSIVCLRSHLRQYDPLFDFEFQSLESVGTLPEPSSSFRAFPASPSPSLGLVENLTSMASESDFEDQDSTAEYISLAQVLSQDISESGPMQPSKLAVHSDLSASNSLTAGSATDAIQSNDDLNDLLGIDDPWDTTIRSRVLRDPWHVFHTFNLPASHSLRKPFARELRDAFFVADEEDRNRINAWGAQQKPKQTYELLRNSSPRWIRQRCRHIIPPPEKLHNLVSHVFMTFGHLLDPQTKLPLFNKNAWKAAANTLESIRKGQISDPPGVPLYTVIGVDKKAGNLPIYRCARGTNATEGGVHTHIRARLPKYGASVRHLNASLLDFILTHNIMTGVYNTTGKHYRGHFSIWTINELQEHLVSLEDIFYKPTRITGWVNGNLYIQTSETPGILPVPDDIRLSSGMGSFIPNIDMKHSFLASRQGTFKAILPIHTNAEQQLFHSLSITSNSSFNPNHGEPDWRAAVKVWNSHANQSYNKDIYYKLVEQLRGYYVKRTSLSQVHDALTLTSEERKNLSRVIHDPRRSVFAPSVPSMPAHPITATSGLLPLITQPTHIQAPASIVPRTFHQQSALPGSEFGSHSHHTITSISPSGPSQATPGNQSINAASSSHHQIHMDLVARQRVSSKSKQVSPQKKVRKTRTCRKCGIHGCPGRRMVSLCRNHCQDCGKLDCQGRNPSRADKPCSLGWIDT